MENFPSATQELSCLSSSHISFGFSYQRYDMCIIAKSGGYDDAHQTVKLSFLPDQTHFGY